MVQFGNYEGKWPLGVSGRVVRAVFRDDASYVVKFSRAAAAKDGVSQADRLRRMVAAHQDLAKRTQSKFLAKIHQTGETDGQAWYISDYFPSTIDRLVIEGTPVMPGELARIIESVIEADLELRARGGRYHGNLKPGNVLLGSRCDLRRTRVALCDVAVDVPTDEASAARRERQAVGGLIHELVTGLPPSRNFQKIRANTKSWERLGHAKKHWCQWCNDLLDPQGKLTLRECLRQINAYHRVVTVNRLLQATAAVLILGGLSLATFQHIHSKPATSTKDKGDVVVTKGPTQAWKDDVSSVLGSSKASIERARSIGLEIGQPPQVLVSDSAFIDSLLSPLSTEYDECHTRLSQITDPAKCDELKSKIDDLKSRADAAPATLVRQFVASLSSQDELTQLNLDGVWNAYATKVVETLKAPDVGTASAIKRVYVSLKTMPTHDDRLQIKDPTFLAVAEQWVVSSRLANLRGATRDTVQNVIESEVPLSGSAWRGRVDQAIRCWKEDVAISDALAAFKSLDDPLAGTSDPSVKTAMKELLASNVLKGLTVLPQTVALIVDQVQGLENASVNPASQFDSRHLNVSYFAISRYTPPVDFRQIQASNRWADATSRCIGQLTDPQRQVQLKNKLKTHWFALATVAQTDQDFQTLKSLQTTYGISSADLSPPLDPHAAASASFIQYNLALWNLRQKWSTIDGPAINSFVAEAHARKWDAEPRVKAAMTGLEAFVSQQKSGAVKTSFAECGPSKSGEWVASSKDPEIVTFTYSGDAERKWQIRFRHLRASDGHDFYLSTTEFPVGIARDVLKAEQVREIKESNTLQQTDEPNTWKIDENDRIQLGAGGTESWFINAGPDVGEFAKRELNPRTPEIPIQNISAAVAQLVAADIGCRLPTKLEWNASVKASAHNKRLSTQPNLPGKLLKRFGDIGNPAVKDRLIVYSQFGTSSANGSVDNQLPFRSVPELSVDDADFHDLIGNVAEWVTDDSVKDKYYAVGGSSFSCPKNAATDMPEPEQPVWIEKGKPRCDVGFRLAMDVPVQRQLAVKLPSMPGYALFSGPRP